MDVVLVFGDAGICDRSDMENLSEKRFSDFASLDRHLASIKKGDGKFDIVDITVFVDDWNDTDDDRDCLEYYKKSETFMGCAKIG